jgi:hypothetical protein
MPRVLVVANLTLGDSDFLQAIRDRMDKGPCEFTLLVPATPQNDRETTMQTMGRRLGSALPVPDDTGGGGESDYDHAQRRVEFGIEQLRRLGAEVDGLVGDANPLKGIEQAFARQKYDEILLSILPSGVSRWLKQDLPSKVTRKFTVPVSVVRVSR